MQAATVVWLEPARGGHDRRALEEWALARGVRLVAPLEGRAPDLAVDLAVGARVEDELDRARDALAAEETDAAERALARAEEILRAHPELPNAAWLMAEVHRSWSARWRRLEPHDAARADAAWQRAEALDGGRVAGLGESAAAPAPTVHARIDVGDEPGASLRIDGVEAAPGEITRGAGEHAIALVDRGAVRWAAWIALGEGTRVRLDAPAPPACSGADVARAAIDGDGVTARGVRCAEWIAVAPAPEGALRIASCEADRCGPLVRWRIGGEASTMPSAPDRASPGGRWPAWATIAIIAGAVVGTTAVTLAATGAFERPAGETRFVSGGVKVQGR